jgi:hypothetical protein
MYLKIYFPSRDQRIKFVLKFSIRYNNLELKVIEEPELEMRLGEVYREYKKRVPMFFLRFPFYSSGK